MSPGGVLFWTNSIEVLDEFVVDKEESSPELAMPIPIKARDPDLMIRKNIGTLNLEAERYCLAIFE